jgi:hypothetical protein
MAVFGFKEDGEITETDELGGSRFELAKVVNPQGDYAAKENKFVQLVTKK